MPSLAAGMVTDCVRGQASAVPVSSHGFDISRCCDSHHAAIAAIASGSAGGPMAALAGLIGKLLGVESAPIRFERSGAKWSVKASALVEMSAEGVRGLNPNSAEPMHLENTGHPAADRFALARASSSRVSALGLAWEDGSGRHNGQYAPFSWRSA